MLPLLLVACSLGDRPPVAVVGGGLAGLSAAIELRACARVTLYEGQDQLGGSARLGDAVTATPGRADLPVDAGPAALRFVDRVRPDVMDWLGDLGVAWRELPGGGVWEPAGGGPGVVAALQGALGDTEVVLGTRVKDLAREGAGVKVQDRPYAAVVLATGGWAGDLARVRDALALGDAPLLRGAAPFADGNGLALAAGLGGHEVLPARVLLYAHGTPAPDDPTRALMLVDGAHVYPVDRDGTYLPAAQTPRGVRGEVLLSLPGRSAWAILDRKALDHIPLWDADHRRPVPLHEVARDVVPTLGELAARLGIPEQKLRLGVVDQNRDARPARPLLASSPRWAAVPLQLTTAKSLTGVEVDLAGRVLDRGGVPVPGVYAAGELAGFGHPWPTEPVDSTMASGAVLTGRIAGRTVCEDLASAR